MFQYTHEWKERESNKNEMFNTRWPLMSVNGQDQTDAKKYLQARNLSWMIAESNGWYVSRNAGDGFLRIVIPAVTTKDGAVYWQARAVSPNVHLRYQSPYGPRCGALIKVNAYPDETERTQELVVVEGPMDALAVAEQGIDAVAIMGMNPGAEAKAHLATIAHNRHVAIILDSEPEAHKAAFDLSLYLAGCSKCCSVHVYEVPKAKDIASMANNDRVTFLGRLFE